MTIPRGIRNNNPGNVRKGTPWHGMAADQPDEDYITFVTPEYGIRAMARILRTYRERHHLKTIKGIVSRWAPPIENPTDRYIDFVAGKMGVMADDFLTFTDNQVADLVAALVQFENGQQPYDRATLLRGIQMERAV